MKKGPFKATSYHRGARNWDPQKYSCGGCPAVAAAEEASGKPPAWIWQCDTKGYHNF
jgi:hypothetical protein